MTPPDWSAACSPNDDDAPWSPERDRAMRDRIADPPALRVLLLPAQQLRQRAIAHARADIALAAVATYVADAGEHARPLAIHWFTPAAARVLLASPVFAGPTPLLAEFWSREAGLKVLLHAVVSDAAAHELAVALRTASVPIPPNDAGYDVPSAATIPLGALWRSRTDFVVNGMLPGEANDFLHRLFGGSTDAMMTNANDIENFLREFGPGC